MLYLEEEYPEEIEEDGKKKIMKKRTLIMMTKVRKWLATITNLMAIATIQKKKDIYLYDNIQMSNNKASNSGLQAQNNDHLILKRIWKRSKRCLEKCKTNYSINNKKANLTVEELVTSLLKPQLSEWLNKYLHALVKEVVEKSLKI